jgi:cytochrome c oxidase subunit 2
VGQFPVFCSEHCGPDPAAMQANVVVHAPDGYEKWLETREQESMTKDPIALGEELYRKHACGTCHSIDGRPLVGPTLRGVFEREVALADGRSARADDGYLRESLWQPQARIVKGFAPAMPTYQGRIDETEAAGLIAYLKTLR